MPNHYTPLEVARALARHAPKKIPSLLEPAVGSGVLLQPLLERLSSDASKIVCIDKNPTALEQLNRNCSSLRPSNLEIVCADFLSWLETKPSQQRRFDCIVMNPPFAGKRSGFVELNCATNSDLGWRGVKRVPVEVAFMAKSIELLAPAGRLLAVVPSSVVASDSSRWLREYLLKVGSVRYVHELPRFTFQKVSARIYLFVFEKGHKSSALTLMNHDLAKPDTVRVNRKSLLPGLRFDYQWNNAVASLQAIETKRPRLKWQELGDVVTILRGEIDSPKGARSAIHTIHYGNGFWRCPAASNLIKSNSDRSIRASDLLIKRVGRNCSKSLGPVINISGYAASDCITIIRPQRSTDKLPIMFAFRVLLAGEVGSYFLESGAGASYLTNADLSKTKIPTDLASHFKSVFHKYRIAVRKRDYLEILRLENHTRNILFKNRNS